MSAESRSHLDKRTQRRFKWTLIAVLVVIVLVLAPLVLNGQLRLDLAHRFGMAPGEDVELIAGPDDGVTLIVAPILPDPDSGRKEYRFRATFLAETTNDGVQLTQIDTRMNLTIPLEAFDFYSNSFDGTRMLFQDNRDPDAIRGVLVNVDTGEFTEMPADAPFPTDIPGDWETGSWEHTMGDCGGISPNAKYIACFQKPKLASYLAGDWELQVRVYSAAVRILPIYRGMGFLPWIGWSNDDSRLYFQNEEGLWVAPVSNDMFD